MLSFSSKKPDEAKTYFEKAIKNSPQDPRGYARLGLAYQMKRNNHAALVQLEKAMSINPNLIDVLSMITAIHLSNKESKKLLTELCCN